MSNEKFMKIRSGSYNQGFLDGYKKGVGDVKEIVEEMSEDAKELVEKVSGILNS